MDHFKEAERLLEISKNGNTDRQQFHPNERDNTVRQTWAQQAQVHATLALAQVMGGENYVHGA